MKRTEIIDSYKLRIIYPIKRIHQTPLGLNPKYEQEERIIIIYSLDYNNVAYEILYKRGIGIIFIEVGTFTYLGTPHPYNIDWCKKSIVPYAVYKQEEITCGNIY